MKINLKHTFKGEKLTYLCLQLSILIIIKGYKIDY